MDREAWCTTVHGVTKNWTRLSDYPRNDPGWAGSSGGRRGGRRGEDGTAPDLEETPVSAWNVSPSAQLFLFQGPFFLVLVLLLYFLPFCSAICFF